MPSKRTMPRVCRQCGKTFLVEPFRVKQGVGINCSRACRDAARRGKPNPAPRKPPNRACEVCGTEFRAIPSAITAGLRRFCSWECKSKAEEIPVTISTDERDLIYLAGLVDGEGTITALRQTRVQTGNESIHCRVIVANTYEPLMEWLANTFGGKLSAPHKTRSPLHKPVLTWYVGSTQAVLLCQHLVPYLKVKRRQAEIVIALSTLGYERSGNRRGRYVLPATRAARAPLLAEMRQLNYRGVPAPTPVQASLFVE
jgi:hypothetical protein